MASSPSGGGFHQNNQFHHLKHQPDLLLRTAMAGFLELKFKLILYCNHHVVRESDKKEAKAAAVIVAHPDDETLWAGRF
jgi:hypothetical protein